MSRRKNGTNKQKLAKLNEINLIDKNLLGIVIRQSPLFPYPPPGMNEIVRSRL